MRILRLLAVIAVAMVALAPSSSAAVWSQNDQTNAGYATGLYDPGADGVAVHFIVPHTDNACGDRSQLAIWVGMGGGFSQGGGNSFVQNGVSLNPTGTVITNAWYELWVKGDFSDLGTYYEFSIPFTANAGDTVWLRLQYSHAHTIVYMQWTNLTTGVTVTRNVTDANLYTELSGTNHDQGAEALIENGGPYEWPNPIVHFTDTISFFYARELASTGAGLDNWGIPDSNEDGGLVPQSNPPIPPAVSTWNSVRYQMGDARGIDVSPSARDAYPNNAQKFDATFQGCTD